MLTAKEIKEYVQETRRVNGKEQSDFTEAKQIGDALGVPWNKFSVDQFRIGMNNERDHLRRNPTTDVSHDEPMVAAQIALTHLNEISDYYTQLAIIEQDAERMKGMPRGGL